MNTAISVGDNQNGYPCPKCGAVLVIISASPTRAPGVWCSECRNVWREVGEINLTAPALASPGEET